MNKNDARYTQTIDNIRKALVEGRNSEVAEMIEGSNSVGFLVEMNTFDRQYYAKIRIDLDMEHVMLEIHPCITVGEAYKRMFNHYAMMQSREKKIGNIRIGVGNSVEIQVSSSFANGPITPEGYMFLEKIAMQFTVGLEDELDMVAHGIIPEKKEHSKEAELRRTLDHLRGSNASVEEDDIMPEESGDAEDAAPYADFLSFLASHKDTSDDADDDGDIIDVESEEE